MMRAMQTAAHGCIIPNLQLQCAGLMFKDKVRCMLLIGYADIDMIKECVYYEWQRDLKRYLKLQNRHETVAKFGYKVNGEHELWTTGM